MALQPFQVVELMSALCEFFPGADTPIDYNDCEEDDTSCSDDDYMLCDSRETIDSDTEHILSQISVPTEPNPVSYRDVEPAPRPRSIVETQVSIEFVYGRNFVFRRRVHIVRMPRLGGYPEHPSKTVSSKIMVVETKTHSNIIIRSCGLVIERKGGHKNHNLGKARSSPLKYSSLL